MARLGDRCANLRGHSERPEQDAGLRPAPECGGEPRETDSVVGWAPTRAGAGSRFVGESDRFARCPGGWRGRGSEGRATSERRKRSCRPGARGSLSPLGGRRSRFQVTAPEQRTEPGPRTWTSGKPQWRWAFMAIAGAALALVWQTTPTHQSLRLDLGPKSQLDELAIVCEGADGTHSGARLRFPDGAPRSVVHEASFSGDELRCEINLTAGGKQQSTVRRVPLHGNETTILLQNEVRKLRGR